MTAFKGVICSCVKAATSISWQSFFIVWHWVLNASERSRTFNSQNCSFSELRIERVSIWTIIASGYAFSDAAEANDILWSSPKIAKYALSFLLKITFFRLFREFPQLIDCSISALSNWGFVFISTICFSLKGSSYFIFKRSVFWLYFESRRARVNSCLTKVNSISELISLSTCWTRAEFFKIGDTINMISLADSRCCMIVFSNYRAAKIHKTNPDFIKLHQERLNSNQKKSFSSFDAP